MRATIDTFLHLLNDNLTGLTVHPIRKDVNQPGTSELQDDAVNVAFETMDFSNAVGILQVSIDVINSDSLSCMAAVQQVWHLLIAACMTPKFDYSSGAPVALGTNIYWKRDIKFRQIKSDFYTHYNCLLTLHHHPQM
jgi:hypothetical protein